MKPINQAQIFSLLFMVLLQFLGFSQSFGFKQLNKCDTISGVRFGLTENKSSDSCSCFTHGIRIELIGNALKNDSSDFHPQARTIDYFRFEKPIDTLDVLNGLNCSIIGSRSALKVNGFSASLISQKTATINGLQVSLVSNIVDGRVNGMQVSTIKNVSTINNGIQVSVANYSIAINGVQIGIFNDGVELYGVQIGLINRANHSEGVQLGLWNISNETRLPIIKFNVEPY